MQFWPTAVLLVIGTTFLVWKYGQSRHQQANATTTNKDKDKNTGEHAQDTDPPDPVPVDVIKPLRGVMPRVTIQPCTVEADEMSLHAQVSGLLKTLGTMAPASCATTSRTASIPAAP